MKKQKLSEIELREYDMWDMERGINYTLEKLAECSIYYDITDKIEINLTELSEIDYELFEKLTKLLEKKHEK